MQHQTLHELLQDLEQQLLRHGYTQSTMTFYRNRWRKLEDFADRKGQVSSTEQLGIAFVQEDFAIPQDDFSPTLKQAQTEELRSPVLVIQPGGLQRTMQRKSDSNAVLSSFSCISFA